MSEAEKVQAKVESKVNPVVGQKEKKAEQQNSAEVVFDNLHPAAKSAKEVRLWVDSEGRWQCEYIEKDRDKNPITIRDYTVLPRVMLVAWRLFTRRRKLESNRKAE